jgi:hypothetical protein
MSTTVQNEIDELTRSVLLSILHDRKEFCRWAEHCDCLREKGALPSYRECFEVPPEYGSHDTRVYVLATLMLAHYEERLPSIGTPWDAILSDALGSVHWSRLAEEILERTKHT